jgi:hypothetical protein
MYWIALANSSEMSLFSAAINSCFVMKQPPLYQHSSHSGVETPASPLPVRRFLPLLSIQSRRKGDSDPFAAGREAAF